jgi:alpha-D-ribose 1-methylphosphonate 5-triphosphate synthase subunit PhnH
MAYDTHAYTGGFSDPVFQSHSTFKTLMDCMARPGLVGTLKPDANPPAPMGPGSGAIALTLCDHDTSVTLSPAMIATGVQSWFAFQTGALVTSERDEAAFAFYELGAQLPALPTFSTGSQEYPDRSTTIVLELATFDGGQPLVLTGPGIKEQVVIAPLGLPAHFDSLWRDNAGLYPRGVDLILVSGLDIVCLPRTVKIRKQEG